MAEEEGKIVLDILINDADAASNIKDIKKSIKALKDEAVGLEQGSEGFTKLTAKAGELQDKLNDVNGTVKALAGNTAENLTKSFSGLASAGIGAFGAIQGAQALFGAENKDLQKTLLKLQALMSLSNGIKEFANIGQAAKDFKTVLSSLIPSLFAQTTATGGATVAQTALNAAMNANPIGLVVIAITALIAAFAIFEGSQETAAEKQVRLNELEKEHAKILEAEVEAIKKRNDINNIAIDQSVALLKAQGASIDEVRAKEREAYLEKRDQQNKILGFAGDNSKVALDAHLEIIRLTNEEALANAEYHTKKREEAAKSAEDAKKLSEKEYKDHLEKLEKQRLADLAAYNARAEAENADIARREKIAEELVAKSKRLQEEEELRLASSEEEKLTIIKNRQIKELELEFEKSKILGQASTESAQALADAKYAIEAKHMNDVNELKRANDEAQAEKDKANLQAKLDLYNQEFQALAAGTQQVLSQVGDLYSQHLSNEISANEDAANAKLATNNAALSAALAQEGLTSDQKAKIQYDYAMKEYQIKLATYNQNVAIKKKEFEVGKKLAIASALIAGAVAAVNALSAAPFFPMAIIGLALATITTGLSIAKIASTKFDGGGSPPTPPQMPTASSAGSPTPDNPSQKRMNDYSLFGTAGSKNNLGPNGATSDSGGPIRAYVSETDVTSTQNRVARFKTAAEL